MKDLVKITTNQFKNNKYYDKKREELTVMNEITLNYRNSVSYDEILALE